jgi:nitroreductase
METIQAIKTRRAVRGWNDQAIPDRTLSQILEAGRFSPSPLNSQPWHFILIRQKETMANLSSTAQHGSYLAQANVIIVVTVDKNCPIDQWLSEHEQHIYSGVCALQNMWLAAWDLGIGGGWVTVDDMTTRKFLDIPNDQCILGSLALGYPKVPPASHSEDDRKPLAEIVFYEKYGIKK